MIYANNDVIFKRFLNIDHNVCIIDIENLIILSRGLLAMVAFTLIILAVNDFICSSNSRSTSG